MLDASVVVDLLLVSLEAETSARVLEAAPNLAAPALLDAEVGQLVRRFVLRNEITAARGAGALEDLIDLPLMRYSHEPLLHRAFDLRDNATFYDAVYVALTEALGATLLTRDAALPQIRGHRARVEVV